MALFFEGELDLLRVGIELERIFLLGFVQSWITFYSCDI